MAGESTLTLPNPAVIREILVDHQVERSKTLRASARSIKVSMLLDATAFVGLVVPNGERFGLPIDVGGRTLRADLATKSLRKAAAAVALHGPTMVAVVLVGQLEAGDRLSSAGLSCMPKTPKAPSAPAA